MPNIHLETTYFLQPFVDFAWFLARVFRAAGRVDVGVRVLVLAKPVLAWLTVIITICVKPELGVLLWMLLIVCALVVITVVVSDLLFCFWLNRLWLLLSLVLKQVLNKLCPFIAALECFLLLIEVVVSLLASAQPDNEDAKDPNEHSRESKHQQVAQY